MADRKSASGLTHYIPGKTPPIPRSSLPLEVVTILEAKYPSFFNSPAQLQAEAQRQEETQSCPELAQDDLECDEDYEDVESLDDPDYDEKALSDTDLQLYSEDEGCEPECYDDEELPLAPPKLLRAKSTAPDTPNTSARTASGNSPLNLPNGKPFA